MGKTAQASETGFWITEDITGGHHNPKNPEHSGYCWIFCTMNFLGNWNKNLLKFLASNTTINMQTYHW